MKVFFKIFNLLMLTIAVYAGVDAGYNYIFPDDLIHKKRVIKDETAVNQDYAEQDKKNSIGSVSEFSDIYMKNLFGTLVSKVENRPDIDLRNIGKTKLNLKLLGTVVGFDESYAVILADNKQGLYKETNSIKDAVIKRIFRQKVVLTRNGKDEILEIAEEKGQKSEYYDSLDNSINQSGENQYKISREFIDKSLQNINSLMRQARARPHFDNGKPDGIKIDSIRPFSLFNKMGLENGDVIVGANGNKIKTVNDAIGLYNNLRNAKNVSLQIKRGGSEQTIDYSID